MAKLDSRGDIAAGVLVVYIPCLILSVILVLRHGFKRQAGWVFLLILSAVRVVGSGTHIAAELMANPSTGLIETYFILDNVGLSPLMMATIGFLNTVGQGRFQENHRFTFIILRVLALVTSVAMILTIIGGVDLVDAKTTDAVNAAEKYRHIGAIVYAALFGLITLMHFWFWIQAGQIMPRRRSMLLGISASIPFLFLRTAYSVLSSFAPTSLSSATPVATNTLSKFSTTTGSWQIYLGMSVAAELVVVIIYLVVGTTVPTSRELDDSMDGNYHDGNPSYKMYG